MSAVGVGFMRGNTVLAGRGRISIVRAKIIRGVGGGFVARIEPIEITADQFRSLEALTVRCKGDANPKPCGRLRSNLHGFAPPVNEFLCIKSLDQSSALGKDFHESGHVVNFHD